MTSLTAIVLAAGVNRRLGKTATPKSLLPLTGDERGPSFLERHIAVLRDLGVAETLVVLSEPAQAACPRFPGMRKVVNPFDTAATGSTLSLLCALRAGAVPADHGLLIMDADIVYERALMTWIVARCGSSSALFTTPAVAGDDEEVRVYGRDADTPFLIGKGLAPDMTAGMTPLGESLGVVHVAPADTARVRATSEWLTGWPPDLKAYGYAQARSEHEEVWQYFFAARRMAAVQVPSEFLFMECDTPGDYDRVCNEVFPAIVQRDGG